MLRTLSALQGVNILTKEDQKKIKGRGGCGVKIDGQWYEVNDANGSGGTKDEAQWLLGATIEWEDGSTSTVTNWCCDSCSWNQ